MTSEFAAAGARGRSVSVDYRCAVRCFGVAGRNRPHCPAGRFIRDHPHPAGHSGCSPLAGSSSPGNRFTESLAALWCWADQSSNQDPYDHHATVDGQSLRGVGNGSCGPPPTPHRSVCTPPVHVCTANLQPSSIASTGRSENTIPTTIFASRTQASNVVRRPCSATGSEPGPSLRHSHLLLIDRDGASVVAPWTRRRSAFCRSFSAYLW